MHLINPLAMSYSDPPKCLSGVMVKAMSLVCFPVCVVILVGCVTPYQQMGFTGGYSDQYLGDDIFLITVRVNGFTDEATAYEYFHRRANELCQLNGYARYEVLEFGTSEKKSLVYSGNQAQLVQKPRVYGRIKCFRE